MATAVRRRIGVMVPSTNTTCEADFNLVVPRGVTVHGQRLWMTNDASGDAAYARMNAEIETGARYLATAKVDVIAYGCTTGSFSRGPGWDREMLAVISREAGVPSPSWSSPRVRAGRRRTRCSARARRGARWRRSMRSSARPPCELGRARSGARRRPRRLAPSAMRRTARCRSRC